MTAAAMAPTFDSFSNKMFFLTRVRYGREIDADLIRSSHILLIKKPQHGDRRQEAGRNDDEFQTHISAADFCR